MITEKEPNNNLVIISVLNTKGGATKTTSAINIARGIQQCDLSVAVGETDPQRSLRAWEANRTYEPSKPLPKIIPLPGKEDILGVRYHPELQNIDVLVIDGAGGDLPNLGWAHMVSTLTIFVSQPTPLDIKPLQDIHQLGMIRQDRLSAFLLSRIKKGNSINDAVKAGLGSFGIPVLENSIRELTGFKTCMGEGLTVFEYSAYKKEQEDIMNLVSEIFSILEGRQQ